MTEAIIIGDIHLHPRREASVGRDFAEILRASAGCDVIFSGDLIEMAMCPGETAVERVGALARAFPEVFEAMRVPRSIVFVLGNHDAELAAPEAIGRLCEAAGRPIDVHRWYYRRGQVHVEHGNQYDPDCAFDDPENPRNLPLGTFMMERFLRHIGALDYLEDVEKRPFRALWRTVMKFGPRAPIIISKYVWSSLMAVRIAGQPVPPPGDDPAKSLFARPTMASRWETFHRLYLGRIFLAVLMILAAVAAFTMDMTGGWAATGLAVLGIAALAKQSHVKGRVARALAEGALRVAALREAGAVVFGHAHQVAEQPPYFNTGSFGLPRERLGRPYLIVEDFDRPRIVRAWWKKSPRVDAKDKTPAKPVRAAA